MMKLIMAGALLLCAVTLLVSKYAYAGEPEDQQVARVEGLTLVDPSDIEWQAITGIPFPDGLQRRPLHRNERTQGGAAILRFPAGYLEPRHYHTTSGHSAYVLKGRLMVEGKPIVAGEFFYAPPNVAHGPNEALEETEILLWTDGPLDLHLGDPPEVAQE